MKNKKCYTIGETDTIYINSTDGINKTEKNTAHIA